MFQKISQGVGPVCAQCFQRPGPQGSEDRSELIAAGACVQEPPSRFLEPTLGSKDRIARELRDEAASSSRAGAEIPWITVKRARAAHV